MARANQLIPDLDLLEDGDVFSYSDDSVSCCTSDGEELEMGEEAPAQS